jgi:CARDB protein
MSSEAGGRVAKRGPDAMSDRDLDIDFDFFDEPETAETVEAQRVPRRARRRPGPPRPPTGLTPLLRLVGLIAAAIFIVVLLVFWVQSCQGSSKHSRYQGYMASVGQIGRQSAGLGQDLNRQLTTPGVKLAALETQLAGLARQEQQLVDQANGIDPPGPLRTINQHVVEALQFRASGLAGLAVAFRDTAGTKDVQVAGTALASQAERFVASDVVWDDLFRTPAKDVLAHQNVSHVQVPDSNFVQNPDLASSRTMASILQRIRGASAGPAKGGLHGTALDAVKVLPSGTTLSTSTQTTVTVGLNLGFEVAVKDSGDSLETGIKVTLTIQQKQPIERTQTIDLINPGETKKVVFRDFPNVSFGEPVTVKVDVAPVPHEANAKNNSADYPVLFSLPQ